MNRELKKLVNAANKASNKCVWSSYPMAPGYGLTAFQRVPHQKALTAQCIAQKALKEAGLNEEAAKHEFIIERHSWVVNGVGCT